MSRRTAIAMALLVAVALGAAPRATAQGVATERSEQVELLLTRGTVGWQAYVWTLDRTRLQRAVADLEEARHAQGGAMELTQRFLTAYGDLVLGRAESGARGANELRAVAPGFGGLLLLDALSAVLAKDHARALDLFDAYIAALEEQPPDGSYRAELLFLGYLHRGAERADAGRPHDSRDDLEHALRIAREARRKPPAELVERLALAHQQLSEYARADELIRGLLREDPGNAALYYDIGLLYASQGKLEEARAWYEQAVARRRDYPEAHAKLASIAGTDADEEPARLADMRAHLDAYRAALGPDTDLRVRADVEVGDARYWRRVANAARDDGRVAEADAALERAAAHCERALQAEPRCRGALVDLVAIALELGWPDERVLPLRARVDALLKAEDGETTFSRTFC